MIRSTAVGNHLDELSFAATLCMLHMRCFPLQAREERKSSLRSVASLADVDDEPLFCFETALKTCYWCVLVHHSTFLSADDACLQSYCFISGQDCEIPMACCTRSAVSEDRTSSAMHMSANSFCPMLPRSILVYRYQEVHSAPLSRRLIARCLCSQSWRMCCVAHVQLTMRMGVQVKEEQDVNMETAMQLYQLEHFELVSKLVYHPIAQTQKIHRHRPAKCHQHLLQLWERRLDTKALIAWNQETVVLSFRGTATFSNVLADLSVSKNG